MSGHSKWSTIKRQKGVADARRSAVFTKLARQIAIAARAGKDPESNFKLRLAIDRARAENLPNDNIDRAIRAGSGEGKEDQLKEAVYEGFGPGRVAILIHALTDNANRTTAELRSLLTKFGGDMASANSVSWMFALRGVVRIPVTRLPTVDADQFELELIDAGAQDVRREVSGWTIESEPADLHRLQIFIAERNLAGIESGVEYLPTTTVEIDDATRTRLFQLFESLDDHPDVSTFASNEK